MPLPEPRHDGAPEWLVRQARELAEHAREVTRQRRDHADDLREAFVRELDTPLRALRIHGPAPLMQALGPYPVLCAAALEHHLIALGLRCPRYAEIDVALGEDLEAARDYASFGAIWWATWSFGVIDARTLERSDASRFEATFRALEDALERLTRIDHLDDRIVGLALERARKETQPA